MGILPLRLPRDRPHAALQLAPGDEIEIDAMPERLAPRTAVPVAIHRRGGDIIHFEAIVGVETGLEAEILRAGGIIPSILRPLLAPPDHKEADKIASLAIAVDAPPRANSQTREEPREI
jgi:aconitate hydratase